MKFQAAKHICNFVTSPENHIFLTKNDIIPGTVNIDNNTGESRASIAQSGNQHFPFRELCRSGDDTAECFVYYLPNINSITPGDVVVTSGTDSLYPKGLKIGSVSAVSLDAGSDGTYAIVSPAVDFQRIEEVFILRTVIETDSDVLPSINLANPNVPTATPRVNVVVTATPAPTEDPYWYRPTPTPGPEDILQNGYIGSLIEDKWAESN